MKRSSWKLKNPPTPRSQTYLANLMTAARLCFWSASKRPRSHFALQPPTGTQRHSSPRPITGQFKSSGACLSSLCRDLTHTGCDSNFIVSKFQKYYFYFVKRAMETQLLANTHVVFSHRTKRVAVMTSPVPGGVGRRVPVATSRLELPPDLL